MELHRRKHNAYLLKCLALFSCELTAISAGAETMGSVFGRESGEILPYEVIKDAPAYEIRAYEAHPVVQVTSMQ